MLRPEQIIISAHQAETGNDHSVTISDVDFTGYLSTLKLVSLEWSTPIQIKTVSQQRWQVGMQVKLAVTGHACVLAD